MLTPAFPNLWDAEFEKDLVPETHLRARLSVLTDYDGTVTVSSDVTDSLSTDTPQDVINNSGIILNPARIASFEQNYWVLDGRTSPRTGVLETCDYWVSTLSDGNTVYFTLGTTVTETVPGFTITFDDVDDGYCTEFAINCWLDSTWVDGTETIIGNTKNRVFVPLSCSNFNRISIAYLEWSKPNQRTRIRGISLGLDLRFDKDEIMDYSFEANGDLMCADMTSQRVEFSVDNTDGTWDVLNPNSLTNYLTTFAPIEVYYGVELSETGTHMMLAHTLFLTEWTIPKGSNTIRFTGDDILTAKQDIAFDRSSFNVIAKADNTAYYPDSSVGRYYEWNESTGTSENTSPSGYVNAGDVLVSTGCYAKPDGSGKEMPEDVKGNGYDQRYKIIIGSNEYWVDTLYFTLEKPFTAETYLNEAMEQLGTTGVTLTADADTKAMVSPAVFAKTTVRDIVQIIANAQVKTVFIDKKGNLAIGRPTTTTGVTIPLDWQYTYPEVNILNQVPLITVQSYGYYTNNCPNKEYTRDWNRIVVIDNTPMKGDSLTIDNPFILSEYEWSYLPTWETFFPDVVVPIHNLHFYREQVSGEIRANPRLELFDVISVETKYKTINFLAITNLKYTYNGGFKCTFTARSVGGWL